MKPFPVLRVVERHLAEEQQPEDDGRQKHAEEFPPEEKQREAPEQDVEEEAR
jgi:hypothetical protein